MKGQQGQSLVEFAVGSSAMLLMLLGVITLSGFQEIQRRGISAARQVAFESTWRSSGIQDRATPESVFFHHLNDEGTLDAIGRARYVAPEDVEVDHQSGLAPGLAGKAESLLLGSLQVGSSLVGGSFGLEPGGYVTGNVDLRLAPHPWLPEPFRHLDLALSQPFAILSEPWNGAGPRNVEELTASLVPARRLLAVASFWKTLAAPLTVLEPSIDKLCLGIIEPDEVPEDRLGPVINRSGFRRPCQ